MRGRDREQENTEQIYRFAAAAERYAEETGEEDAPEEKVLARMLGCAPDGAGNFPDIFYTADAELLAAAAPFGCGAEPTGKWKEYARFAAGNPELRLGQAACAVSSAAVKRKETAEKPEKQETGNRAGGTESGNAGTPDGPYSRKAAAFAATAAGTFGGFGNGFSAAPGPDGKMSVTAEYGGHTVLAEETDSGIPRVYICTAAGDGTETRRRICLSEEQKQRFLSVYEAVYGALR